MQENYDDIKHLTRPQYDDFPPMPMSDRAAQFSPFAALVGYDDAVAETARLTDSETELTETQIYELNKQIAYIIDHIDERPLIRLTYFVPDKKKAGGAYTTCSGNIRRLDDVNHEFIFTDKTVIDMDRVIKIETDNSKEQYDGDQDP
ncbi:MAG: hypothetical protein K6C13_04045 [Oscillospiraceae bacterium]|nr:hypothetical protein [Oscillospiraceae bacterium]